MKSWVVSQTKSGKKRMSYENKVIIVSIFAVLLPVAVMLCFLLVIKPMDIKSSIFSFVGAFTLFMIIIAFLVSRNRSQFHAFIIDHDEFYWAVFYNKAAHSGAGILGGKGARAGGTALAVQGMKKAIAKAQNLQQLESMAPIIREKDAWLFRVTDIESIKEVSFAYKVKCRVSKRESLNMANSKMASPKFGRSRKKTILILKDIQNVDDLIVELKNRM